MASCRAMRAVGGVVVGFGEFVPNVGFSERGGVEVCTTNARAELREPCTRNTDVAQQQGAPRRVTTRCRAATARGTTILLSIEARSPGGARSARDRKGSRPEGHRPEGFGVPPHPKGGTEKPGLVHQWKRPRSEEPPEGARSAKEGKSASRGAPPRGVRNAPLTRRGGMENSGLARREGSIKRQAQRFGDCLWGADLQALGGAGFGAGGGGDDGSFEAEAGGFGQAEFYAGGVAEFSGEADFA